MNRLGADGNASYIIFGLGWLLAPVYSWRTAAGDALINGGFDNFKDLFNKVSTDPVAWDINQLKTEQSLLQSIHERFLEGHNIFQNIGRLSTDTSIWPDSIVGANGGVSILGYKSRVEFGCKLLEYSKSQGCVP